MMIPAALQRIPRPGAIWIRAAVDDGVFASIDVRDSRGECENWPRDRARHRRQYPQALPRLASLSGDFPFGGG